MGIHMGNNFHDILCLIADAFHIGDHLHGGRDDAQISCNRLLAQQQFQTDVFYSPVALVNAAADHRNFLCQILIPTGQGFGSKCDDFLAVRAHIHQFPVQLIQLFLKKISHCLTSINQICR